MHNYTKGIYDIEWADVEAFCNTKVSENTYLDYKREFPTDLAKTAPHCWNTQSARVRRARCQHDGGCSLPSDRP